MLQRTGGVNEATIRLKPAGSACDQLALDSGKAGQVAGGAVAQHVGTAAQGAGGRTGRIDQHGIDFLPRLEFAPVSGDEGRAHPEPAKIALKDFQPLLRAVDGGHLCAGGDQLSGFSARGGAQIHNMTPGQITEQRGWQCGGGILNPPMSFVKTVQLCGITVKGAPDGAPVDQVSVKDVGPILGIALWRDVEGWRLHHQFHHPAGLGNTILLPPALAQPFRQIVLDIGS